MTNNVLDLGAAARRWWLQGWPPFPLPRQAKKPPPDGVTGYGGVDLTHAQLDLVVWRGNIGVRMPADVLGLDVDAYDGKPGAETLAALVEQLGPLPPTVISNNGRGGISGIRFYRVPVGLGWVHNLPGIEVIQRTHRYAVVWPSMHPEGRQYVLVDEQADEVLDDVPNVADLPEMPWAWVAYLSRPTEAEAERMAPSMAVDGDELAAFVEDHDGEGAAPGYLGVIVAHFNAQVDAGHSRHDTAQHCLIWAMESAAAGLFPAFEAWRQLAEAWVRRHTDARRAQLMSDRRVTEYEAMARHAVGRALSKTPADLAAIRAKVVGPVVGIKTLAPPSRNGHEGGAGGDDEAEAEGGLAYVDWAALRSAEDIEHAWLVEGFWPAGRAMALWAPAKTGKSELALVVAANLALGIDAFSGAAIEPVDVLYLDYEMTEDDLRERLDDLGLLDADLHRLHYALVPALPALDLDLGGLAIEAEVVRTGSRAVVFDTFGRAVAGKEDEADTVRAFYRYTGARLKRMGVAYLRTDHAGKDVAKGQRGSSAKRDDVDIVWQAQRSRAGTTLSCAGASRLGWVGPSLDLDRIETDEATIVYRRRHDTEVLIIDAHVAAKMTDLDAAGIPLDWGRRRTIKALADKGIEAGRWATLSAAIKARKLGAKRVPDVVPETNGDAP
jgi:hypothetical protein